MLFILFLALIIFGPKKLPELGKGLGDGIKGFKEAIGGHKEEAPKPVPSPDTVEPPAKTA